MDPSKGVSGDWPEDASSAEPFRVMPKRPWKPRRGNQSVTVMQFHLHVELGARVCCRSRLLQVSIARQQALALCTRALVRGRTLLVVGL